MIEKTSGYIFLFGGTVVSWASKKQNCVAKHTMEAEYVACNTAASNTVWLKRFVNSLKCDLPKNPVNVFCDNQSTIFLIKSGANSSKGKHIDIHYHYIQDIVERGEIKCQLYLIRRDGSRSHDQKVDFEKIQSTCCCNGIKGLDIIAWKRRTLNVKPVS